MGRGKEIPRTRRCSEKMKIAHIAIPSFYPEEDTFFYEKILKLKPKAKYTASENVMNYIFNTPSAVEVVIYEKKGITLEVFHLPKEYREKAYKEVFHICIVVRNREKLVKEVERRGYEVKRLKREGKPDLIFIKDKSGNLFEVRENM